MSCCVAGARRPSPSIGSNGASAAGVASGSSHRHSAAPKPTTMFEPPAVTAGSRNPPSARTNLLVGDAGLEVELEVVVRTGALGEDPGLRHRHRLYSPTSSSSSSYADSGGHEHMRLRSPNAPSMRLTGGQYLSVAATDAADADTVAGNAASSHV